MGFRWSRRKKPKGPPPSPASMVRGGLVILLLSLLFASPFLWRAGREAWIRATWQRADATITACSFDTVERTGRSRRGNRMRFRVLVTYEYEWAGARLTGTRPRDHGPLRADREALDRALAQYAVGTVHRIWVNPARPAEAVLLAFDWRHLAGAAVPLPFVLIGLYCLVAGTRAPRPATPQLPH